jgi:phage terminase large subunit
VTATPTVVRYELRGAAIEMFNSREKETVISGPAGTGKSVPCLLRMHIAALQNPGFRGLIVRKTAVSLGSTTLVTYKTKVAAEAIEKGLVTWYGGSREEAACYRYHTGGGKVGASIVVGGMDMPIKIMSSEYDLIFADEATEFTIDDWEAMRSRLRNGRRGLQQLMGACNPDSEYHWLNQRAQEGRLRLLYSTHRDNPAYTNPDGTYTEAGRDYVEGTLAGLTGIRRKRLFEGKWTSAEGLVYEGWDPAVHLVDRLPKGSETWTRWWTVDFGFTNPFVCQFWAEDGDGRLWLYREIYKTKTLVEDHAKAILRLVRRCAQCCKSKAADHDCQDCKACQLEWTEPRPRAVICDHDAEDRATLEKHLGMGTSAAHKTVKDGIQAVQSRLKVQPDGRARLYILRNAVVAIDKALDAAKKPVSTEQEIAGYVWPENVKPDQRENPVKLDDHGMDAMRYMVAERDLGGRPRVRVLG